MKKKVNFPMTSLAVWLVQAGAKRGRAMVVGVGVRHGHGHGYGCGYGHG